MCTWGYKLMDVPYFNLACIIVYPYKYIAIKSEETIELSKLLNLHSEMT